MFNYVNLLKDPKRSPCFLVAEIGINHDGSFEQAKSAIAAAADAGADAVKFQIYNVDSFYSQRVAPDAYALFQKLSLSLDEFYKLCYYAEQKNILCFAAPFSEDVLLYLIEKKIFPIKIASGDALTEPWIDMLLENNCPFILSTGSLSQEESEALTLKIAGAQAALLYCVSQYPAPPETFDLKFLDRLQELLPHQAVGFSDHSMGIPLSLAAVARGAKIVERHFTLSPQRQDLDHPLSLSPQQFSQLNEGVRMIEKALGSGCRVNSAVEKEIRTLAGRGIYAARSLKKGEVLNKENTVLLRPGNGVSSTLYRNTLGKSVPRDFQKGEPLDI